ncbi:replicative DNA helicase loader DnaI [Marininema mesophilum]|uniref:Replicative DNA helicase loader DnaI n=1 Tax=Marininema mesophilum TaxID=1048340 RepID=A0A1H2XR52_9BACL|nr:primosomal protein DnaI [Marininema mesophilum]SDW95382.1 replicative DNA helicase loader DnaI [Marininema mesophilum]
MERIDRVVSPIREKLNRRVNLEQRLQELLTAREVKAFRMEHPEVPQEVYRRSIGALHQLVEERGHCDQCPGLENCPNLMQGHQPELAMYGGYLDLRLQPCPKLIAKEKERNRKRLIKSHHIPTDILSATFSSITPNNARKPAIIAAVKFCQQFAQKRPERGLYLYGTFGVGKSRIAGAMAQKLVDHQVDSLMVYVPDFLREIKESIRDGMIQEKLDALKKATVLILDDLGAETLTPWTRDEIIGALLQYRMTEKMPTVITSNLDLDELEDHFAYSDKGGTERMKAKRLMERIRPCMDDYCVEGPNWREQG